MLQRHVKQKTSIYMPTLCTAERLFPQSLQLLEPETGAEVQASASTQTEHTLVRHARTRSGHPPERHALASGWIAGSSPAMTRESSERVIARGLGGTFVNSMID